MPVNPVRHPRAHVAHGPSRGLARRAATAALRSGLVVFAACVNAQPAPGATQEAASRPADAAASEDGPVSLVLTSVAQQADGRGVLEGASRSRVNHRLDATASTPLGGSTVRGFVHLRAGRGQSIATTPAFTGTLNATAVEAQSPGGRGDYAILAEAWLEADLPLAAPGRALRINVGKIDPFVFFDQNGAADDESRHFLNGAFVHNPLLDAGRDAGADAYGFAPGARAALVDQSAAGGWALSLGVFLAKDDGDPASCRSHPVLMAQAERSFAPLGGEAGRYRLYAWHRRAARGLDGRAERHAGLGLSIEQPLGAGFTAFARYGQALRGTVRFDRVLTSGGEWSGAGWGRPEDAVGVAAGWLRASGDLRRLAPVVDADGDGVPDFPGGASGTERLAEVYYRLAVGRRAELTADLQAVHRPAARPDAPLVRVATLRLRIGF